MSCDAAIKAFQDAVQERHEAGSAVRLWLRDDDAVEPSEALDRLLELSTRYSIPLMLAVIPAFSGAALAQRLALSEQVRVAVHGWSHRNHAGEGEKKQELGPHRPDTDVLAELSRGVRHLQIEHGAQFVPVLVPPWNRISTDLIDSLVRIGFQGLSAFGSVEPGTEPETLTIINTHVDLIDWKGTRGGRERALLLKELTEKVRQGVNPIGFLTHHLVHDVSAWRFLDELFSLTASSAYTEWMAIDELLPNPRFPGQQ